MSTMHNSERRWRRCMRSRVGRISSLATPNAGVDDFYVKAIYKFDKWGFTGVYHDFSAQDGNANWGSEFDVSAGMKITDRYGLLLKAAVFSADNASFSDVTKFWVMLTANF